jgi:uncharacterized lipoprotein
MADALDRIVSSARAADPSLDQDAATRLASQAAGLEGDAPEIARQLLALDLSYDVSWVNAVAKATVDERGR